MVSISRKQKINIRNPARKRRRRKRRRERRNERIRRIEKGCRVVGVQAWRV